MEHRPKGVPMTDGTPAPCRQKNAASFLAGDTLKKAGNVIMAEIKYDIIQKIAVLSQRPRGWERQLNLISWNDGEPKYDIRDWSPDGTRMGKGISLSAEELGALKGILEEMDEIAVPDEPDGPEA